MNIVRKLLILVGLCVPLNRVLPAAYEFVDSEVELNLPDLQAEQARLSEEQARLSDRMKVIAQKIKERQTFTRPGDREVCRAWFNAVRERDILTMSQICRERGLGIINMQDRYTCGGFDRTALHYAAQRGYTEIAAWLIERGANSNIIIPYNPAVYDQTCGDSSIMLQATALEIAARYGHLDIVKVVLPKTRNMLALKNALKEAQRFSYCGREDEEAVQRKVTEYNEIIRLLSGAIEYRSWITTKKAGQSARFIGSTACSLIAATGKYGAYATLFLARKGFSLLGSMGRFSLNTVVAGARYAPRVATLSMMGVVAAGTLAAAHAHNVI